ncbi:MULTISPECIES: MFS transporter [unclassified Streptomyces]|uniref:MFS transporter n=1 Tax=Streptomyces evansiae TaxID=3075535 RepID=A0ABU2R8F8_9ACTN|nr:MULTISPECIES: MFS transporter [unclassified Streptomyces]EFK98990.1 integral membrane transporter [Streptomyces sp. SPB78]MDT0412354.1 MFS transporter [Streptomyces sp. DSM 41979]MDT0424065.1 MFS transporter [Streptomyces sp. DSM 41859]WEH26701.1 MFS transporter [Streptomyces sp. AM 3-1-1]SCE30547.1 MFS transporter, CP family, cyanate transporter [Streptomyces sp. DfronAA-171]
MAPEESTSLRSETAPSPTSAPSGPAPGPTRAKGLLAVLMPVGIVLAALNLRPAITSLGSLLEEVRDGLGMNGTLAGLLTSVPPFCFAVFGSLAPRLSRRFGSGTVVCGGMVAITAGLIIRPFTGSTPGFLAATALTLAGIAVSNVLMPVVVKNWFPDRVGSMTGLYSMALAVGTSLAAAVTVPLNDALGGGWQGGLAIWAALGAVAVLPWAVLSRQGRAAERESAANPAPAGPGDALRVTRSRTAWSLACFFGLQSTAAYITMGWMPQIFRDAGISAGTAGVLLAVTMALGIPLAFVIPRVAIRLPQQGPVVVVLGLCGLGGYLGLALAPAGGAWIWAFLIGISNCAFPLALTMVGLRARTGPGVVKLSAFAQSTGYLISIPGPLLVGVLNDATGGWGIPILFMACLMVPQIIVGTLAGRNRTIEDEHLAKAA